MYRSSKSLSCCIPQHVEYLDVDAEATDKRKAELSWEGHNSKADPKASSPIFTTSLNPIIKLPLVLVLIKASKYNMDIPSCWRRRGRSWWLRWGLWEGCFWWQTSYCLSLEEKCMQQPWTYQRQFPSSLCWTCRCSNPVKRKIVKCCSNPNFLVLIF